MTWEHAYFKPRIEATQISVSTFLQFEPRIVFIARCGGGAPCQARMLSRFVFLFLLARACRLNIEEYPSSHSRISNLPLD